MALSCSQAKNWVRCHYERHEDGVVAKSVMYKHYEDVCRAEDRNVMETSIFGRVVKSVFPDVTIRRLGGRDNLKYYYCGIQAKESSPYAVDNTTTTRPKRRLRKRELVTDKVDVHSCLRWLHDNYVACTDSSVVKTDVYERYCNMCKIRGTEPLSIQYFGMVITHAFPSVTKRKLGPRSNQQKFYFGIEERQNLMVNNFAFANYYNAVHNTITGGKQYRDQIDYEEEEEFTCQSPDSDMSDNTYQNVHNLCLPSSTYESEISRSPNLHLIPHMFKQETDEPVDYSLSSLRLKDEPIDSYTVIKEEVEPLNLHIQDNSNEISENQIQNSPSKVSSSRKIYKPRFHYNESMFLKEEPSDKSPDSEIPMLENPANEMMLKHWIIHHFHASDGSHLDRGELYELYETYCKSAKETILPMVCFDEMMLKVFSGVVTMIHPTGKTFYEGLCVSNTSSFVGRVKEYNRNELQWEDELSNSTSMELSPSEDPGTSHSSPLTIDEDEPPELIEFSFDDDVDTSSEVLRDGKYYLRTWLQEHFYCLPDSCVLKADAYKHYEIHCKSINQVPFEMNVFGKIVRQVFPEVSIRRLGGRVKPQYHYCGIAVKPESPLMQFMSGKDPAQRSRKKEIATDNRSAEIVIDFLRRNYECGKHKITMKSEVFDNYNALCESINESPVTLNYFGKLVKHCFPQVEVRKFGGRSDPVWYYFGMAAKCLYPNMATTINSINKYGSLNHPDVDYQPCLPPNANPCSPVYCMEPNPNLNRHPTSPIPISLHRSHIQAMGHFSADSSPSSFLNNHLQASLRVSSLEDQMPHGSPADLSHFLRESITPQSPGDAFYPRSPIDSIKNHSFPLIQMDGIKKEGFFHYKGRPHFGSGQVVPSQTPPNMLLMSGVEETAVAQRPVAPPRVEEYGIFNDMVIE